MKLLVIGAGYVGMALLKRICSLPYQVYVTTTRKERVSALQEIATQVICLNPFHQDEFKQLVDSCNAAVVLVAPQGAEDYRQTYLQTAERLHLALEGRTTPFHLIYTSSTSVCEGIESEWVTEEMELFPQSKNPIILLETEQCYLRCNASSCILRLGGIYGPGRELRDRARMMSGKEIPGTGDEATNHIHINDIVEAIVFCLERGLKGIYHLVNDQHPTRKELYHKLCGEMNIPNPIWNSDLSQKRKGGYKVSNQKIKDEGFSFQHQEMV